MKLDIIKAKGRMSPGGLFQSVQDITAYRIGQIAYLKPGLSTTLDGFTPHHTVKKNNFFVLLAYYVLRGNEPGRHISDRYWCQVMTGSEVIWIRQFSLRAQMKFIE